MNRSDRFYYIGRGDDARLMDGMTGELLSYASLGWRGKQVDCYVFARQKRITVVQAHTYLLDAARIHFEQDGHK